MNTKCFLKIPLFLILFGLVSCQNILGQTHTPTVTQPATIAHPTATKSVIQLPTSTNEATPEPTNAPFSPYPNFDDLGSGQYLLIRVNVAGKPYLYLFSNQQLVKKIPLNDYIDYNYYYEISVSNDGSQLLIMYPIQEQYYNLDLLTKEKKILNIKGECYRASWSPDKKYLALDCFDQTDEIYLFDRIDGSISRITDCLDKHHSCGNPAWSFDGQWLAYYRADARSGVDTIRGIYLFNTSCINNNNCMKKQIGPIGSETNPAWTPENELVFSNSSRIRFSKLRDGVLLPTGKSNQLDSEPFKIKASPDGEYVAFIPIQGGTIYVYSRLTDQIEVLLDGGNSLIIVGWVVIPE